MMREFIMITTILPYSENIATTGPERYEPVLMSVGRLGFEPRYTPPEGAVLPLDDLPGSWNSGTILPYFLRFCNFLML